MSIGHWNTVGNLVEGCWRIILRQIDDIVPGPSQDGIDVLGAIIRSFARLLRNHVVNRFESFLVLRVSGSVPDAFDLCSGVRPSLINRDICKLLEGIGRFVANINQ
jgi:hypothetical protein